MGRCGGGLGSRTTAMSCCPGRQDTEFLPYDKRATWLERSRCDLLAPKKAVVGIDVIGLRLIVGHGGGALRPARVWRLWATVWWGGHGGPRLRRGGLDALRGGA